MHQHLLKLLVNNKGKGFFRAEAAKSDEATIYLYDMIVSDDWWGGITPMAFVKEMANITAPTIHLRINSPGGDVFAARAMQTAMREHSSKIIAHIDGLCASAATFLAITADESVINQGAMFMIHESWTLALGNAKDFTDMANLLRKIDGSIASEYVGKTGQTEQQIVDWMAAETYFMDEEAVDYGFVDAIAKAAPKAQINWDLSAYANAPGQNNQKPAAPIAQPEKTPESAEIESEQPDKLPKNRPKYREMLAT